MGIPVVLHEACSYSAQSLYAGCLARGSKAAKSRVWIWSSENDLPVVLHNSAFSFVRAVSVVQQVMRCLAESFSWQSSRLSSSVFSVFFSLWMRCLVGSRLCASSSRCSFVSVGVTLLIAFSTLSASFQVPPPRTVGNMNLNMSLMTWSYTSFEGWFSVIIFFFFPRQLLGRVQEFGEV